MKVSWPLPPPSTAPMARLPSGEVSMKVTSLAVAPTDVVAQRALPAVVGSAHGGTDPRGGLIGRLCRAGDRG